MSSEIQELIRQLREAEARRHAAAVEALDDLEENMIGSGAPAAKVLPEPPMPKRDANGSMSKVGRVLDSLDTQEYRSLEEIMDRTGLGETEVRAALYARAVRSRIDKKKKDKRMIFRLISGSPRPQERKAKRKGRSAAERVRELLTRHPDGLRTGQVQEALHDIKVTTIGSVLYNMKKKSRTVIHDETTGVYRLKSPGELS